MTLPESSYPSHGAAEKAERPGIAVRLARQWLPALQGGRLTIVLPGGDRIESGAAGSVPAATLRLRRWRALYRILLEGEDGFSNGYIKGDWTTPDLVQLLELGARNESALSPRTKKWLLSLVQNQIVHALRANTRRGSRRNISAHYDLGNDFFSLWLDGGMNYSSALYRGRESLEQAQRQKLDRVAQLLDLKGGDRILEIGCGWGALAERLIRRHDASVTGVTLSSEQLAFARRRLATEVKDGRADLRLQDYRDLDGRFDRIASIEMIEAVGERYWPQYFAKLRACLAAGGIAVIQAITIAESRFAQYRKRPDFIQRHIFPGGMLPTHSVIEAEAARAGLKLVRHESFGDSYVHTLREWRSRFAMARPKLEALGFNQGFQRMWDYYLAYCEAGFRSGVIDVGFYQLSG